MGTRAIIAGLDSTGSGWSGAYVDTGGHPAHTGRHLYRQIEQHFQRDLDAAYTYYVSRHPGGWYRIDETLPDNNCYCHTWNRDTDRRAIEDGTPELEWLYILRPEGLEIRSWREGAPLSVPWGRTGELWQDIAHSAQAQLAE